MRTFKRLFIAMFSASLLALTGCLDVGGGTEGSTTGKTIPPMKNMSLVCDALTTVGGSDFPTYQGVLGNLYYLEDSQPRYTDVNDYINHGVAVTDFSVFFNNLNIPTRPFDRGFISTSGQVIQNSKGNTLYEWFGFDFQTEIAKGASDVNGNYQLAILSDDGAVMSVRGTDGSLGSMLVDNNGQHPTRFACATAPISVQSGQTLPVSIRYNQGPRYHIAMTLMWRPWPANPNDPECGQQGNDRYFDSTQDPPAPKAAYNGLLSRGWAPLNPDNYMMPAGIRNTCNIPAPTISEVSAGNVVTDGATLHWTTDVPSTSQVEIQDFNTGAVVMTTPIDLSLVTTHAVIFRGVISNTVYTLVPISMSDSGRTTRGEGIIIRTRR